MAQGDIVRFTREVSINGQLCVNVMHFMDSSAGGLEPADIFPMWDPSPAGSATSPEFRIQDFQRGFSSYSRIRMTAQRVLPTPGFIFESGFLPFAPAALDSGLPTYAQASVIWQTATPGRSGRGGIRIAGVPESRTDGNNINATGTATLQAFIDAYIGSFTASGAQFAGYTAGVLSRLLVLFFSLETVSIQTELGTMLSRRAGRGV